jgi:ZIP family zinc transporter
MEIAQTSQTGWLDTLRAHAREHAFAAWGLGLSVLAVVLLLAQSLVQVIAGEATAVLRYALAGGAAGFIATALGAVPALFLRGIPQRVEDSMLGMAAGMMLAASAFSLLLPGLEAGAGILGSKPFGAGVVVLGMALGVLLMLGLDAFTPHEHDKTGPCGPGYEYFGPPPSPRPEGGGDGSSPLRGSVPVAAPSLGRPGERCYSRVWLFVFAIALHNLPEGMAIGVGFSHADMGVGLPLVTAIALQDIPEGLAVALALRGAGLTPTTAVLVAGASGLLEPLGALLGVGLASGLAVAYPVGLGLAAGAMIFVVSHEVIPETHRNGHQTPATIGLMAGFALMMALDTTLG